MRKESLCMEKKSLWQCYNSEEFEQLEQVNALYRERLDGGKQSESVYEKPLHWPSKKATLI